MKTSTILESKDVKRIIAKYFKIEESQVIQSKYSYTIIGMNTSEIEKKLEE